MQVDYLIVGQGICGTMLSWFLHKEGKSFLVIDANNENASSKIAAGLINPVTGRRYVDTWMIEVVMPFAIETYRSMEAYLDDRFVQPRSIIDFFPTPQMRLAFLERMEENTSFLRSFPDQNQFNGCFHYDFGCGEIFPAWLIQVQTLIPLWRKHLEGMAALREQFFDVSEVAVDPEGIRYQDIECKRLIFCDGTEGANNPWFSLLPFSPNKGEALIIECKDLPDDHVFKKGLLLAPLFRGHQFWVGSNYLWEFKDENPSQQFFHHATSVLNQWLKPAYKILAHKAAVRPATLERRPFVGFHPVHTNVGILNGMGTKGTSLAPFFANQLAQHLVYDFPIAPEADVRRFSRILQNTR